MVVLSKMFKRIRAPDHLILDGHRDAARAASSIFEGVLSCMMRIEESLSFYRDNRMRLQSELTSSNLSNLAAAFHENSFWLIVI
jgi:hypothetical protein